MCICKYFIFGIDTFLCFDLKKGYKQVIALGSSKTYCYARKLVFTSQNIGSSSGASVSWNIRKAFFLENRSNFLGFPFSKV